MSVSTCGAAGNEFESRVVCITDLKKVKDKMETIVISSAEAGKVFSSMNKLSTRSFTVQHFSGLMALF